MIKIFKYSIIIALFNLSYYAQDSTVKNEDWRLFPAHDVAKTEKKVMNNQLNFSRPNGQVTIHQDSRLTNIENQLRNSPYIYGYTLQLEVSQQKNIIKDARYRILKISPDIELDDPYESPNIYLYAGRFYDRASAYQYKNEISGYFPNAIVVGPKKMDLPRVNIPDAVIMNSDSSQIEDPRNN